MKCPSCRRLVAEPVPACPHCRVSLQKLDPKFGVAPKHLGSLTDLAVVLFPADHRKLQTFLTLFRSRFPQITYAILLMNLPEGTPISEYTFWVANRMHFSTPEAVGENNFDLLLVVNIAGEAGLSVGYGLENFIAEEDLGTALAAGRAAFAAHDWAEGIELCTECLMARLRHICRTKK